MSFKAANLTSMGCFSLWETKSSKNGPPEVVRKLSKDRHVGFKKMSRSLSQIEHEKSNILLSKEDEKEFLAVFKDVVAELTERDAELTDMEETRVWLAKVLEFNVPHGKRTRGLGTALAYRYFAKNVTPENVKLSYILGWAVEMLQAFFLIADDIMDGSETRRGEPCWYKVDDMGPLAFNDALLVESGLYVLLGKFFQQKPYYTKILDIFHDVSYKTGCGQSLDTLTGLKRQIETFTMERYTNIVKFKTSYYSFYLPAALGMTMAEINDPNLLNQVQNVTLDLGHYFQVQDDYLDCFGNPELTGKIGTDIQDCKCSWLFVTAMELATPAQKEILRENYGYDDQSKVDKVKALYIELKVPEIYAEYEEKTYIRIINDICTMDVSLPKKYFSSMLDKIYRRNC